MNEHIKRQAEAFMSAAEAGKIPENVQAIAEEGVARSRVAFETLTTAAKEQVKAAEEVALAAHAGMKTIGNKLIDNTATNAEAVFDAARSIARARSVPEALRLQAEFVQRQVAAAGAQTKELFELTTRVATQTFESANEAVARSAEKVRKGA